MRSASGMLVDDELKIIKLFTPPFDKTEQGPRLHQELSAGRARERRPVHPCGDLVRHRAGRDGPGRRGLALLLHAQPGQPCARCRRRPNATASSPMWWPPTSIRRATSAGRGGWTWYTGSAGWLYRAAVEGILGIRKRGQPDAIEPGHSAREWDGFSATLRLARPQSTASRSAARAELTAPIVEVDGKKSRARRSSLSTAKAKREVAVRIAIAA